MTRLSLLFLTFVPFATGCLYPAETGYDVDLTVTIPVEVQRAFSAAEGGLLLVNYAPLARLCDPLDRPLVIHSTWSALGPCGDKSLAIYASRMTASDLMSLDAGELQVARCGQSAMLTSAEGDKLFNAVYYDGFARDHRVASAPGGSCIEGRQVIDVTLALDPPPRPGDGGSQ